MRLFYTVSNEDSAKDDEQKRQEKINAIIEIVLLVFITTFIPSLIKLGRPPTSFAEIWVELLVAILASCYAYARIRGIDIQPTPKE